MTRSRLVQRKERKKLIIKRKIPVKRKERSKLMKRRNWSNERATRTPHELVVALWVLPAWATYPGQGDMLLLGGKRPDGKRHDASYWYAARSIGGLLLAQFSESLLCSSL